MIMTEHEVTKLMSSSNSAEQWDANCDKVKAACGGYPPYWYAAVILSGLHKRTCALWGSDGEIKITTFPASKSARVG